MVEAISVDKPHQRAYILDIESFKGMRGSILKYYIDEKLRIFAANETKASSQTGYGDHVIDRIAFASNPEQFILKLKGNKQYEDWQFEDSDLEEEIELGY